MQPRILGGIVLTIVALVLSVGTAQASRYYMTYGQARAESKEYARHTCNATSECVAWGLGPCFRKSPSGFSCIAAFFYPGPYLEEELECNQVLHWGVRRGFITLLSTGEVNCFYL